MNTDESREALKAAASFLSNTPNISKQLIFVANSIGKYLNGEEPSLDHAFGLKKGRGQYERGDREKHIKLVCAALKMRLDHPPKSWKKISELSGHTEKEFKRLWERYEKEAIQRMADTIHIVLDDEPNV